MKKIVSVFLCLSLCLSLSFGAFADGIRITVDGTQVKQVNVNGDPVPELEQSDFTQPVVPIRAVLKAMGYFVDYADGTVIGGVAAEPAIRLIPDKDPAILIDGTTFVPYDMLGSENGLMYKGEVRDGEIAYTNTFEPMTSGYYRISLDGKYLTGSLLPEKDLVETVTDEDGNETEKVTSPQNQIRTQVALLADKNDTDTQLWLVKELADRKYVIVNKHNGLALDVNSWSTENGAKIIQYTLAGGTNQQWVFSAADDKYLLTSIHSKLPVTTVGDDKYETVLDKNALIQSFGEGALWTLELIETYVNPVELALETEAFKELDSLYQNRFEAYFFNDVDFSQSAKNKAETFLREHHFKEADKEEQKELILSCLALTYSDLLGGWMQEKLTANYEIVSITRTADEHPEVLEDENAKNYYIYTIAMECNGPEDIHTFTIETVDENDEAHIRQVAEAMSCYEPPVRKTLKHFYYTGDKFGTWNAWAGEVWNNTGGKSNVDGMLTMFSHELGHVIDSYFTVGDDVWRRAINADIIPTSGYGNTNRWEDFGEFSRLYLMARGNEERMAAIEKIYPARTKTYRAALYNLDNEYYKEFKDCYDEVTASVGSTEGINGEMYYTVETEDGMLTNNDGVISVSKAADKRLDNKLWQISAVDSQLIKLYSKADGKALVVPTVKINEEVGASINASTALGFDPKTGKLTVSETGFKLSVKDGKLIAAMDEGSVWSITPVEKIEGMGKFTITSNGKYLVPSTAERGARLTLSDDEDMSVWYINKLPNGVGYITNTANDFAIDISGASEEEGAAALTYTLSRNANQMWLIEANENGTVSFKAQHSDLYLAADDEGLAIQSAEKYEWTLEEKE